MITYKELKEQIDEQNPQKQKAAELLIRCWAAATASHVSHLISSSYSNHKVLQEFYEGVIPLVDVIMENFIARYGRLESVPINIKEKSVDPLTIVGNLTAWIDQNRQLIAPNTEIQALIDNLLNFCNSISYKLRELR